MRNRGYYMAAQRYKISLWVLNNISLVRAANEWNIFQYSKRNFVSPSNYVCNVLLIYSTNTNKIVFCSERRDLSCSHRNGDQSKEVGRFWTALEVVFISMQITYPITYFPLNWNILTFCTTFRFASFHFILQVFCASWVISCEFMLSKGKKLWGNVVFTTTAIHIYFTSLTLTCKLLFICQILLETKKI